MTTPQSVNPKDLKVHQAMASVIAKAREKGWPCRVQSTLTDGSVVVRTVNEDKCDGDWQKLVSIPYEMLQDDEA